MKIISKFRDYYDIGASMGVDETIVYVRNLEMIERPNKDLPTRNEYYSKNNRITLLEHLIGESMDKRNFRNAFAGAIDLVGFCGKIYPVYTAVYDYGRDLRFHYEPSEAMIKDYLNTEFTYNTRRHSRKEIIRDAERFFDRFPKECPEIFHELKTPVFVIPSQRTPIHAMLKDCYPPMHPSDVSDEVYLNPSLKDIGFYKVVDAYTAFQDISMFITGVLGVNQIPPVQISDTDMRDAKGFDDMSFKKAPTKRKKK